MYKPTPCNQQFGVLLSLHNNGRKRMCTHSFTSFYEIIGNILQLLCKFSCADTWLPENVTGNDCSMLESICSKRIFGWIVLNYGWQ